MTAIADTLAKARVGLPRLSPHEAQGELPGALVIDRTVLEWRLDPTSPDRIPEATVGQRFIIVCRQGYSSSLAARDLRELGVDAGDLIGGMAAWLAAGLPVNAGGPVDERR